MLLLVVYLQSAEADTAPAITSTASGTMDWKARGIGTRIPAGKAGWAATFLAR
jgi:hypothetical protein